MIEFVKNPLGEGLVPITLAQKIHASMAAKEKALGLDKIDHDAIKRAIKKLEAKYPPAVWEKIYPCRTCKTISSDAYKSACEAMREVPCYITASFRGCAFHQPKPIVSR